METMIALNSATACTSLSPSAAIWQDVLAQAMTGELIAAMNYTSLAEICDDPEEVADALEHADGERVACCCLRLRGPQDGTGRPQ